MDFTPMTVRPAMISGGLDIFENELLTITVEDWSNVRSPSRAKRRRKRGFPQRVKTEVRPDPKAYRIGSRIYMHPAMLRIMREHFRDRMTGEIDRQFLAAIRGDRLPLNRGF